jgi:hypothetical protein
VNRLDIQKQEMTEEDIRRQVPQQYLEQVLKDLAEDGEAVFKLDEEHEFWIERKEQTHFFSMSLRSVHAVADGREVMMNFSEESDGTRRLLNLIPALHGLKENPMVFFIDEIDRSMHPMLSWKFLDCFLKTNGHGQLLVTTHESNLLDHNLVRRDEVWFAEKNLRSATQLYSLSEFQIRKDLEIRKHYLQGRFGAVPFLGEIDRLFPEKGACE